MIERLTRIFTTPQGDVCGCDLDRELRVRWQGHARYLEFLDGLWVMLCLQLHPAEIVMGKRVAGGQFHCVFQRCASWFELVFGPFEKSQIAIGIFEERIQANRFEIL